MRYEKPMVINLGVGAQDSVQGGPLGCISGSGASAPSESCGAGPAAAYTCAIGSAGPSGELCLGGNNPGGGSEDCFSGSSAYYCGPGSVGNPDPQGCRSGPTP